MYATSCSVCVCIDLDPGTNLLKLWLLASAIKSKPGTVHMNYFQTRQGIFPLVESEDHIFFHKQETLTKSQKCARTAGGSVAKMSKPHMPKRSSGKKGWGHRSLKQDLNIHFTAAN